MKKQFYLKPEIYVINAEPEMLLAGSGELQGLSAEGNNDFGSSDLTETDEWEK